jgi:hypothetical protein
MSHISSFTKAPFGWNYKPAEKHCWLIFCERKILFRLKKNKPNKTDYKPDEHGLEYAEQDLPLVRRLRRKAHQPLKEPMISAGIPWRTERRAWLFSANLAIYP